MGLMGLTASRFSCENERDRLVLRAPGFRFHLVADPVVVIGDGFGGCGLPVLGTTGV